MERSSGHTKVSPRVGLLAVAVAVAAMMGTPVSAADPVTPERLLNVDKEPGNWLHHHKDFSAQRFSTLKDINRDNVKNLKVAYTIGLGSAVKGATPEVKADELERP